jgi:hypothetical protein
MTKFGGGRRSGVVADKKAEKPTPSQILIK